jgi:hypothetical protein
MNWNTNGLVGPFHPKSLKSPDDFARLGESTPSKLTSSQKPIKRTHCLPQESKLGTELGKDKLHYEFFHLRLNSFIAHDDTTECRCHR